MHKSLLFGLFAIAMVSGSVAYGMHEEVPEEKQACKWNSLKTWGSAVDRAVGASVGVAGLKLAGFSNAATYAVTGITGVSGFVTGGLSWASYMAGASAVYFLARTWLSDSTSTFGTGVKIGKRMFMGAVYTAGVLAALAALKSANSK